MRALTLTRFAIASCLVFGCTAADEDDEGGGDDSADTGGGQGSAVNGDFVMRIAPDSSTCPTLDDAKAKLVTIQVSDGGKLFVMSGATFQLPGDEATPCRREAGGDYSCEAAGAVMQLSWLSKSRFEGSITETRSCGKVTGTFVGTKAVSRPFAPDIGTYRMQISQPVMTTCSVNPFTQPADQTAEFEKTDAGIQIVKDAFVPLQCAIGAGGVTSCSRTSAILDLHFDDMMAGGWTGKGGFEGVMQTIVSCAAGKDCTEFAADIGKLPCTTFFTFEATRAGAAN